MEAKLWSQADPRQSEAYQMLLVCSVGLLKDSSSGGNTRWKVFLLSTAIPQVTEEPELRMWQQGQGRSLIQPSNKIELPVPRCCLVGLKGRRRLPDSEDPSVSGAGRPRCSRGSRTRKEVPVLQES